MLAASVKSKLIGVFIMTDNRQLICELDTLKVTAECLLQTFLAIEEGMLNGVCEIQPQAICVPITA